MAQPSLTADINTNPLAAAQVATYYGPQTQTALRRSQYLADALRQLQAEGGQNIRGGWGELGAKLLATAILQRSNDKGQDALIKAMAGDQQDESTRLLAPIQAGLPQAPTPATAPQPDAPPPQQPSPPQAPPQQQAPAAPQGASLDAHQFFNDFILPHEGGLNRSDLNGSPTNYGINQAAHPNIDVTKLTPEGAADIFANEYFSRYGADKLPPALAAIHGDTSFINPAQARHFLQASNGDPQKYMEMRTAWLGSLAAKNPAAAKYGPAWAKRNADLAAYASSVGSPPPPPPPDAAVATAAPQGSAPPVPPQGNAASAAPQWPTYKPGAEEYHYVQGLLMAPRTHALGVQEAIKLRAKMAQPAPSKIVTINGLPFYVPDTPGEAPTTAIPVPAQAMTHVQTAQQAGIAAPPGTTYDTDPLGNHKPVFAPPTGQMVASPPGQPYREQYVPGGTNDPTRPQAPPAGYQYTPPKGAGTPTSQTIIPGSPADPQAPMNVAAAADKIQGAIQPTIDLARAGRQSIGIVDAGYQLQNGSGDVAMLKGLNQLISHGVVRPNDMDQQLKSDGVAGGIAEITQYLTSKGILTPETRQKVYQAARALYGSTDQQFKSQVLSHRATTDAIYGKGAFDKFVFPQDEAQALGWADAPPGPGGAPPPNQPQLTPGSRDAAVAEARRRGLIP